MKKIANLILILNILLHRPRPQIIEIQESESAPSPVYMADRRADAPPPGFAIPEGIRVAEQQIASGR